MDKPYVPPASVQQKAERELERLRRALGVEPSYEEWLTALDGKEKSAARKRN